MSRIQNIFKDKPAYVGYITAGDGGLDYSLNMMRAMVAGGVDIIEVGVPFSDPVADGPQIQAAAARALKNNTSLSEIFQLIEKFRQFHADVPLILFSYYNPILQAQQQFDIYQKMAQCRVDGCLVVDLSLEESAEYYKCCVENSIDPIFLISPSTSVERVKKINSLARGMLYYVCRKGTTGVKSSVPEDLAIKMQLIKSAVEIPVIVGFGISDKSMAAEILQHADGFVIGSLFVKAMAENIDYDNMVKLVKSLDPREKI